MSPAATIFLVVMAIAGCGSGSPVSIDSSSPGTGSPGSGGGSAPPATVELVLDATTIHKDLQIRWIDLEDSRCPTGVVCIWAGQTIVTLELARNDDETMKLDLVRRAGRDPESANAFDYTLRLLEVEPHPKEGVTPERGDYLARIEITEP